MVGILFAVSIVVLSQAAILVRFAEAHALAICFWRMLAAALLLAPLGLRNGGWRSLALLDRAERRQLLVSGAMLFAHFYFFFRSVQETSIANSTILFSLNPVLTAIGAWLWFRERVSPHLVLALFVGVAGVAVLFWESAVSNRPDGYHGDAWGALSAAGFSAYILTGKRVRQKIANTAFTTFIYTQAAVYALGACLALGVPLSGYPATTWWAFLALAVFPTLLGHALFTYCLNDLNVTFMSCMTLVGPVLAASAAHYLFAEPFTPWAGAAFALTCASMLALYWPNLRPKVPTGDAGRAA